MNDNSTGNVAKASLWREAWAACTRNARELLPWVLGFSALIAVCDFYIVRDEMQMAQDALAAVKNQTNPADISSLLAGYTEPPVVRAANICMNIISFIGFYYFTVLYLKREPLAPGAPRPELSPSGFWKWFVQIIMAAFCVMGVGLAVAAVGYVLGMITHAKIGAATDAMTVAVTMLASIAVMLVVIYTGIRFLLVSPLALSGVAASVKTSWDMTKGHWWRLLWGYFCIGWSVFVVFAAAFLALIPLMFVTGWAPDSLFILIGISALMALYAVVNLAMSCIYFSVACRILMAENQEKRAVPTQGTMQ